MKRILPIFAVSLFAIATGNSQNYKDTLNMALAKYYAQEHLPGFAVAVVNANGVLYQNTYGYANLQKKKPYTLETLQMIASTTKTTIAFAIAKLIEEGKMSLDDPINDYLPFKVYNPGYKNVDVTVRHLVTHTAGIVDTQNNYDLRGRYFIKQTDLGNSKLDQESLTYLKHYRKNKKTSLKKYCQSVFSRNGKWYDESTFLNKPPGSHYQYSNLGAVLAAYIVEQVSGERFERFIEREVFKKLNFHHSTFSIQNLEYDLLTKSYIGIEPIETPVFGENTYPDGGMFTNVQELSRYLIEMIKGFNGKSDLLTEASFKMMMGPMLTEDISISEDAGRNFKNIGIFWKIGKDGGISHNGGNALGGAVYMGFDPKTSIGRVFMTNCDVRASQDHTREFLLIWRTLEKYGTIMTKAQTDKQ